MAEAGADRGDDPHEHRQVAPPALGAVDRELRRASRTAGALEPHRQGDVPHRHVRARLQNVVITERVVVDDEPVALNEHRHARAGRAGRPEHALVPRRPGHMGIEREGPPARSGRGRHRDGRHRQPVAVAPVDRMGRAVVQAGSEDPDPTVIQGQHAVALGLAPPQLDQLGQLLGPPLGKVVAFRPIHRQVVELPLLGVEVVAEPVTAYRLPRAGHQSPRPRHLEVLQGVGRRMPGVAQHRRERVARDRHLLEAPVNLRRGDAQQLVDGGHDIGHVDELVPHGAPLPRRDPRGPVDHQRHVHAALVGVLLVPLERAVAALGPAPRVVHIAAGAADLVQPGDGLLGHLVDAVEPLHLVHHPERAALLGRPVVGQHDQDGVVELAQMVEAVDQPPDLVVGVVEEGGEGLLEAGREDLVALGQGVPRLHARVAGRQPGPLRDHAEVQLAPVPALPHDVPSLVVAAPVLGQVAGGRLMGGVGGAEGEVGQERPVGADPLAVADHQQQLIDEVLAEVVAVLGAGRRVGAVIVDDQLRVELVGLALQEAVEAVEAPAQRPLVEGPSRR